MRTQTITDGRSHQGIIVSPDDHHAAPTHVSFSNISQLIAAGADFDLDVSLPRSDFQVARLTILGPLRQLGAPHWSEFASIEATRDIAQATGHSARFEGMQRSYVALYSKQNGDTYLSDKIFDQGTSPSNRYIALKDCWLTRGILKLRFHNYHISSATLWVKGQTILK